MRKWTKAAGLIFVAAASVYSDRAIGANPEKAARSPGDPKSSTDVKLLDDRSDPFAEPATRPAEEVVVPANGGSAAPLLFNEDGTFSLSITSGADLVEQLRVIGFQAQRSIIPSKDVRGTLPAMDLYDVTVKEALDAILHVNGFGYKEQGNFVFVYTAKELQEMEKAARVTQTQVFRVHYTPAANAVTMIKPVLSNDAQVSVTTPAASGIESGTGNVGGDSHATEDILVVTDYPENLDRVRALLADIDKRPQQVLIEATILRATLTEDNALGVDFNVLGGVNFTEITSSNSQFTGTAVDGAAYNTPASSVGTGNSFTQSIGSGLKIGWVTDNVSIFLAALEEVTDTTVLANPKVLALNKQKGEVIVGRKDGYLTTTVTETSQVQTVEFIDTGTRLIFRPYIGNDGYIRMEIHPEDSTGGVTATNLPFKVTTEVTSNVMIKDGHTIVIGGLFRDATDVSRSQVPLLGNIPVLGHAFRKERDRTTREEVIILLTPHIIKDDSAFSAASIEQIRNGEKLRVGVRRGMMPWGRERLAEWWYNRAVDEMAKPRADRRKALFALDAANNLNPKFIEAINLRDDLRGREVTGVDNSSIRSFVTRAILEERVRTPATMPAVLDDSAPASPPATQPVATALALAPATRPTSGSLVAVPWTWETFGLSPQRLLARIRDAMTEFVVVCYDYGRQIQEDAVATDIRQGTAGENAPPTSVTELPMEELPGPSGTDDQ